MQNIQSNIRK